METATFRLPPPQVLVPGGDDYAHRQCFVASVLEGWGARKELVLGIFKASCKMLPLKQPLKQVLCPHSQGGWGGVDILHALDPCAVVS